MSDKLEVLLVDDEEIVCKRLRVALEKSGYAVEVYQNGQAALERLREKSFDIVVSDLRIDEIDGIQILEAVQLHSPRTQTILITGYASVEVAREAQAKGAFDCIAKPFMPKDLKQVIERAAKALA